MIVQMHYDELCRLLSEYVRVGYAEAVRSYEPPRDLLRRAELLSWLKFVHADVGEFRLLEKRGDIKARRQGKADNSPLYYSKREVMEKMASLRLYRALERGGGWEKYIPHK